MFFSCELDSFFPNGFVPSRRRGHVRFWVALSGSQWGSPSPPGNPSCPACTCTPALLQDLGVCPLQSYRGPFLHRSPVSRETLRLRGVARQRPARAGLPRGGKSEASGLSHPPVNSTQWCGAPDKDSSIPLSIIYSNTLVFEYKCSLLCIEHTLFTELTTCEVVLSILHV